MGQKTPKQFLKKVTIISTFGGLLFGYDTGVVNGALGFMARPDQLNLTPFMEGLVASGLLFGAAIGSFLGGRIADAKGRRKVLLMLAGIFFFAAVGCSLAPTAEVLVGFRFILGLAVGGASVTVPAYLAEMSPAENRGQMVTQNELMIVTGQLCAFVLNAIIGVVFGETAHVWRYMLVIASLPAVVLWFGMLVMPESPRWLVMQGRVSEAMEVLTKARDERRAIAELNEIQDNIAQETAGKTTLSDLATPWVRRIVFIAMGVAVCQQISGVNSIMYYGTQILTKSGFSTEAALIGNIANGVISVLATFFGIWMMGRHGRRPLLMTGQIGTMVCLCLIGIFSSILDGTPALPFVVLSLTVSFLFFQQGFLSPITWLLLSELFPVRLRGMGMGAAVLCLWLANFVVGLSFPVMMEGFGLSSTFFIFAGVGLLGLLFSYNCVPETRGRSLEQIEKDFRSHGKHAQAFATSTDAAE
ncbi:MAG: sugar porter family MFS transporter [Selenomonadaceae bacterium]